MLTSPSDQLGTRTDAELIMYNAKRYISHVGEMARKGSRCVRETLTTATLINTHHDNHINAHQRPSTHPRRTQTLKTLFALRSDGRCILLRWMDSQTADYQGRRVGNTALGIEEDLVVKLRFW